MGVIARSEIAPVALWGIVTLILRRRPTAVKRLRPIPPRPTTGQIKAINWLQRAIQNGGDEAITHEVRDGRMIPKPGK
jgi:hypothetical protein